MAPYSLSSFLSNTTEIMSQKDNFLEFLRERNPSFIEQELYDPHCIYWLDIDKVATMFEFRAKKVVLDFVTILWGFLCEKNLLGRGQKIDFFQNLINDPELMEHNIKICVDELKDVCKISDIYNIIFYYFIQKIDFGENIFKISQLIKYESENISVFKKLGVEDNNIQVTDNVNLEKNEFFEILLYIREFLLNNKAAVNIIDNFRIELFKKFGFEKSSVTGIVETSNEELNRILSGGIPKNQIIIIDSPFIPELRRFISDTIIHSLKNNESCIYISSKDKPDFLYIEAFKNGIDNTNLISVDIFSGEISNIGAVTYEGNIIRCPKHFGMIKGTIAEAILKFSDEKHKLVIIDIFDYLLKTLDEKSVFSYIKELITGLKRRNSTAIFIIDHHVIGRNKSARLYDICDGLLILKEHHNKTIYTVKFIKNIFLPKNASVEFP